MVCCLHNSIFCITNFWNNELLKVLKERCPKERWNRKEEINLGLSRVLGQIGPYAPALLCYAAWACSRWGKNIRRFSLPRPSSFLAATADGRARGAALASSSSSASPAEVGPPIPFRSCHAVRNRTPKPLKCSICVRIWPCILPNAVELWKWRTPRRLQRRNGQPRSRASWGSTRLAVALSLVYTSLPTRWLIHNVAWNLLGFTSFQ